MTWGAAVAPAYQSQRILDMLVAEYPDHSDHFICGVAAVVDLSCGYLCSCNQILRLTVTAVVGGVSSVKEVRP